MGNWTLEVWKMALYMAFPVVVYHVFNQPEYFEEYTIKMKRQMYPPEDERKRQQLNAAFNALNERVEQREAEKEAARQLATAKLPNSQ